MTRVFILDDRSTNRLVLRRLAQNIEDNIEVLDFPNPPPALAAAERTVPDLVITDFNMPEMTGAEFVAAFRKLDGCADVPVIVVTANEDLDYRYKALEAGATDFLASPVDHYEFRIRARNLLTLRRQRLAREMAERANEAKTAFLANMSHELRTPLNAIIGFAEIMQHEVMGPIGTPKYLDYVGDIKLSAAHLKSIIDSALDLALIENEALEFERGPVDIAAVADEAVRLLAPAASASGIEILNKIDAAALVPVFGCASKLRQVLLNILSNAIKFTAKPGQVILTGRQEPLGAVLEVADNGIGMSSDDIVVARSRFGQVHDHPHTKKYQGAGLGLPLAIGIVEAHGGSLELSSVPGQGTVVRIELPSVEAVRCSA